MVPLNKGSQDVLVGSTVQFCFAKVGVYIPIVLGRFHQLTPGREVINAQRSSHQKSLNGPIQDKEMLGVQGEAGSNSRQGAQHALGRYDW